MARSAPIIPVNAAMYRHFAIATVMITGCLAMFATGENREALHDQLEAHQQQAQTQQVEQDRAQAKGKAAKSNFTDKRKVKGSFGTDADIRWKPPPLARKSVGFATTSEAELVADSDVSYVDPGGSGSLTNGMVPGVQGRPPGMSQAEYEAMLNGKKKKKPLKPDEIVSEQTMQDIMAASKARSQTRRD